jgi:hypothetical protein
MTRRTGGESGNGETQVPSPFERTYPHIARWITIQGWIEIGLDDFSRSYVRALDLGGMVWEGDARYQSVDDALRALETGLAQWMKQQSIE